MQNTEAKSLKNLHNEINCPINGKNKEERDELIQMNNEGRNSNIHKTEIQILENGKIDSSNEDQVLSILQANALKELSIYKHSIEENINLDNMTTFNSSSSSQITQWEEFNSLKSNAEALPTQITSNPSSFVCKKKRQLHMREGSFSKENQESQLSQKFFHSSQPDQEVNSSYKASFQHNFLDVENNTKEEIQLPHSQNSSQDSFSFLALKGAGTSWQLDSQHFSSCEEDEVNLSLTIGSSAYESADEFENKEHDFMLQNDSNSESDLEELKELEHVDSIVESSHNDVALVPIFPKFYNL